MIKDQQTKISELQESLNEIYNEFKDNQLEFVQTFDISKMTYSDTIKTLGTIKQNYEMDKYRIKLKTSNLVEDVKKRVECCKQLNVQEIRKANLLILHKNLDSIQAFDKDNPLHEIFIWIFGVIYKMPTKNFDLKKVINNLMIEEGREFILKLATFNAKHMRQSEIEATQILLDKQAEYLTEDILLTKKIQLIQLFNIIQMLLSEKNISDEIEELNQKQFSDLEQIKLLESDEKFQSLEIQSMKEQQQINKIFHHSLSTIHKGVIHSALNYLHYINFQFSQKSQKIES